MQSSLVSLLIGVVLVGAGCRRPPEPAATPDPAPSSEPHEIRIGGRTGPSGPPPALYVIDGVLHRAPVDLTGIDPADIVAVEVVRGDVAVARFGANARDGVVVVTTKRGPPPSERPRD